MFDKELNMAKRSVHVSRAISQLDGKSNEFKDFLEIFVYKYDEVSVKKALRELYKFNYKISDIKGLSAALIMSNYKKVGGKHEMSKMRN